VLVRGGRGRERDRAAPAPRPAANMRGRRPGARGRARDRSRIRSGTRGPACDDLATVPIGRTGRQNCAALERICARPRPRIGSGMRSTASRPPACEGERRGRDRTGRAFGGDVCAPHGRLSIVEFQLTRRTGGGARRPRLPVPCYLQLQVPQDRPARMSARLRTADAATRPRQPTAARASRAAAPPVAAARGSAARAPSHPRCHRARGCSCGTTARSPGRTALSP
jgi:hypothetical protein